LILPHPALTDPRRSLLWHATSVCKLEAAHRFKTCLRWPESVETGVSSLRAGLAR
jgi:hypothetical protein